MKIISVEKKKLTRKTSNLFSIVLENKKIQFVEPGDVENSSDKRRKHAAKGMIK